MTYQVQKLDNDALLNKTKSLAVTERKITLEILHHLREISRRRLYALRGFNSIFDYATKELGYSDASAQRRLAAMRLLSEIPEAEGKIKSGELTLTNAAQAQKLFHSEAKTGKPLSKEEKKDILSTLENKSTRQAEKDLLKHSSQPISLQKPDTVKPLTPTHSEVRFLADQELMDQLELIRGFLASKNPSLTFAELFTAMAKLSLASLQPKKPKADLTVKNGFKGDSTGDSKGASKNPIMDTSKLASKNPLVDPVQNSGAGETVTQVDLQSELELMIPQAERSRYIRVEVRRAVYHRDGGACCYVDPVTQRKCKSRKAIQYDHILPFAQGGESTVANVRIYCDIHNRLAAIKSYGSRHMAKFIKID